MRILGKTIVKGEILTKSGIRIGGSPVGLEIGGVDNPVIRDQYGRPYIPGSSLKGKLRSLLEKSEKDRDGNSLADDTNRIWVKKGEVSIHMCNNLDCPVCNIFGKTNGEKTLVKKENEDELKIKIDTTTPTRLLIRDSFLNENSITEEMKKNLDLEWTEVKFENAIDRITSAANPRQTERVPAGAEFDFEMVYNVFEDRDKENLRKVFKAMELLEDDYLGGQGSRGYGRVQFKNIKVFWNSSEDYETGDIDTKKKTPINDGWSTVTEIMEKFDELKNNLG